MVEVQMLEFLVDVDKLFDESIKVDFYKRHPHPTLPDTVTDLLHQ